MSDPNITKVVVDVFTKILLFLLIFGMSGTVDMKNMKRQVKNKRAILTGVLMQFLIMPILGFLAVIGLKEQGLSPSVGVTILMVTASPGGSYSNWWCSLFNADLSLSVVMTAISTILSTALLPANLFLYSHAVYGINSGEGGILRHIDFSALFISLCIVIVAILVGLYCSYKFNNEHFHKSSNSLGSVSGIILIAVSLFFSSSGEGTTPWQQNWSFYVGVSIPCLAGLILANIISMMLQLKKPEVVTLSVECCYQNVGIAASAVLSMFESKEDIQNAMCVPLFYGLLEAIVLGIYCLSAWKLGWTKAPKDEKLCIILAKSYEIDELLQINDGAEENSSDIPLDVEASSPKSLTDERSQSCSATQSLATSDDSCTLSHGSPNSQPTNIFFSNALCCHSSEVGVTYLDENFIPIRICVSVDQDKKTDGGDV